MAVLCVEDLDHLVLTVADIKATCRFYQQVLGMTPFTFGNGRTALSFGNRKINLHEVGKGYLPQAHNPLPVSYTHLLGLASACSSASL